MNKLLFLLSFLILFSCTKKQNRTIEYPNYEAKTSGIYTVQKIEVNDSTTRITMLSEFLPHWWVKYGKKDSITDVETGISYMPIGIEGAEFDSLLWMPDDGDSVVTLIYPPLPPSAKKIDFCDGIFGISLTKSGTAKKEYKVPKSVRKWIDAEVAKSTTETLKSFDTNAFFCSEKSKIVGYIKGFDKRYNIESGIVYMKNQFTREDYPIVVEVFDDGRFEAKLPMLHPIYSYMMLNKRLINFYIEPGQTLGMIIDWNDFLLADRYRNRRYKFQNTEFIGNLAPINYNLASYTPREYPYKKFKKKLATLSADEFLEDETKYFAQDNKLFNEFMAENNLDKKSEALLRTEIELQHASRLYNFVSRKSYEIQKKKKDRSYVMPLPDNYYNFLQNLPLNSNVIVAVNEFSQFINRYEYASHFRGVYKRKPRKIKPEKNFYEYLVDEKIEVDKNDLIFLKKMHSSTGKSNQDFFKNNSDKIRAIYKKYQTANIAYSKKYMGSVTGVDYAINEWKAKDSVLVHQLKLENNLVHETSKVRSLKYRFKNQEQEEATQLWTSLKADITTPFLLETGDDLLARTFPDEEVTAYELPANEKGTAIFKKIADPFKGKILFVDFWATSCGPCVAGIERMKENRTKHKNNPDFDFIFITDERSSPTERYNKFIAEQELVNTYRLSTNDYNYLRQLFKFNGIPRYVVIDEEGRVLNDNFSMYNFEKELDKILEKN